MLFRSDVLLLYRFNSGSVSSQNVQLQLDNFTRNLQRHINISLQMGITENISSLITYNHSRAFKRTSLKKVKQIISQINADFSKQYNAETLKLKDIAKRHEARLRIFLLRRHHSISTRLLLTSKVFLQLLYHVHARKKF